jgi:hypothetical protein
LGTCPNRVIDPVNAARFMTAASTLQRLARSAALNASYAAGPSRTGTPLGCLDIGSSPVQLRVRMTTTPNAPRGLQPARKDLLTSPPTARNYRTHQWASWSRGGAIGSAPLSLKEKSPMLEEIRRFFDEQRGPPPQVARTRASDQPHHGRGYSRRIRKALAACDGMSR